MSTIGGELGQLESLARTFDRQSQAVAELTSSVRGELGNAYWVGPAAERFRGAWSSDFEPALRRLEEGLTQAGAEVTRRREALVQAGG